MSEVFVFFKFFLLSLQRHIFQVDSMRRMGILRTFILLTLLTVFKTLNPVCPVW